MTGEEVFAIAASGGINIGLMIKLLMMGKKNGKPNGKDNGKPGLSLECNKRGVTIGQHDTAIKHLCALADKSEKNFETHRKESRDNMIRLYDKIDELKQ